MREYLCGAPPSAAPPPRRKDAISGRVAEARTSLMPVPRPVSLAGRSLSILTSEQSVRSWPAALLVGVSCLLAWRENGSVDAADWLPYAVFCALLLVAALLSSRALRPAWAGVVGVAGIACLSAWTAISLAWSPVPEEARNDALLAALYAVVFLTALVVAGPGTSTATMLGVIVAGLGALAVATDINLVVSAHPVDLYAAGRLFFPIGYWNAQAAMFLIGFWPAVVLGARRSLPVAMRAISCGAGASLLAGAVLVQSKGGAIALVVSAAFVLAFAKDRLRILVTLLLTATPVIASYLPLTGPFRLDVAGASRTALENGIRSAGTTALLLSVGVGALGALYALFDRRVQVPVTIRRAFAGAALVTLMGGLLAGVATVNHPIAFARSKWEAFKHMPPRERGSSHLVTLGSNRYDFWRVAVGEFAAHPIGGTGQHGFAVAYLQKGRSKETPQRAHSLLLDQLSETGAVGFVFLLVGVGAPLVLIGVRARGSILHAGVLGSGVYWLVHASGDWIWTFPAVGIPLFLMLGIGASSRSTRPLPARFAVPTAVVAAAVALVAFLPPWLSDRLTADAASASPSDARRDLRWARRLDPLAVGPLFMQAQLASTESAAIAAFRRAVELDPRSVTNWYLLGLEELRDGRRRDARRDLVAAQALYPRDAVIAQALARARTSGRRHH